MSNARDDLRQLDRLGDVIDEQDQHRDIQDHERHRHRDRQVGNEFPVSTRTDADEREDRVDERRDEAPERELRDPVADEVAQHARAELGGGERQRHDRDREDERHHGDHRSRDRGQDLPGRIGGAADEERRQLKRSVVGGPIQCVGAGEQRHRQHDLDRRHQPQIRAQRLATPCGGQRSRGSHDSQ